MVAWTCCCLPGAQAEPCLAAHSWCLLLLLSLESVFIDSEFSTALGIVQMGRPELEWRAAADAADRRALQAGSQGCRSLAQLSMFLWPLFPSLVTEFVPFHGKAKAVSSHFPKALEGKCLCSWGKHAAQPGQAARSSAREKASPILQPVEPFTQSPSVNSICNIN